MGISDLIQKFTLDRYQIITNLLLVLLVVEIFTMLFSVFVIKELNILISSTFSVIFTGIVTFFLNRYSKPILRITNNTESIRFPLNKSYPAYEIMECRRIPVENIGRTAAYNCRGYFKTNNNRYHVFWANYDKNKNITINPNDVEYLNCWAVSTRFPNNMRVLTDDGWKDFFLDELQDCKVIVTAVNADTVETSVQIDQK